MNNNKMLETRIFELDEEEKELIRIKFDRQIRYVDECMQLVMQFNYKREDYLKYLGDERKCRYTRVLREIVGSRNHDELKRRHQEVLKLISVSSKFLSDFLRSKHLGDCVADIKDVLQFRRIVEAPYYYRKEYQDFLGLSESWGNTWGFRELVGYSNHDLLKSNHLKVMALMSESHKFLSSVILRLQGEQESYK